MKYLLGVNFSNLGKIQYFLTEEIIEVGTFVVAESIRGVELGKVVTPFKEYAVEEGQENPFSDIIRIATEEDIINHETNLGEASEVLKIVQLEADKLNLGMKVTSADYILDKTKLTISYLADDRVDFRELLKVLAAEFRTRIELRQIGPRDKAKLIGGIGLCGLPLCCSTFLNEFDGISITMAKNQMLALNIPKLSGHCGKLICCLKYEDAVYTLEKKDLPRVGLRVSYNDLVYRISSINIITKMVRLECPENIVHVPLSSIEDKILYNWNPNQPQKVKTPEEEVKQEVVNEEVKQEEVKEVVQEERRNNLEKKQHHHQNNNQQEVNDDVQTNVEIEEQLIMNRINPNLQQDNQNNDNASNDRRRNNRHHFHKKRHFHNHRNQGNNNEEN